MYISGAVSTTASSVPRLILTTVYLLLDMEKMERKIIGSSRTGTIYTIYI